MGSRDLENVVVGIKVLSNQFIYLDFGVLYVMYRNYILPTRSIEGYREIYKF
jgi:hypothetical protein